MGLHWDSESPLEQQIIMLSDHEGVMVWCCDVESRKDCTFLYFHEQIADPPDSPYVHQGTKRIVIIPEVIDEPKKIFPNILQFLARC